MTSEEIGRTIGLEPYYQHGCLHDGQTDFLDDLDESMLSRELCSWCMMQYPSIVDPKRVVYIGFFSDIPNLKGQYHVPAKWKITLQA